MAVVPMLAGLAIVTGSLGLGFKSCRSQNNDRLSLKVGDCIALESYTGFGIPPEFYHKITATVQKGVVMCQGDNERDKWYGCNDTEEWKIINSHYVPIECPTWDKK
jgi:hypothetical protein